MCIFRFPGFVSCIGGNWKINKLPNSNAVKDVILFHPLFSGRGLDVSLVGETDLD